MMPLENLWNNPVFRREFFGRLKSPKLTFAILAVAVLSSALVLLRWPTDGSIDIVSQGAVKLFRPLAFALMIAIMMLVPPFPATSIVAERRTGTLTLLMNSPMPPWAIYLGKFGSNLAVALILIAISLPALIACVAMGGITFSDHILPFLLVLAAMAVQYTAVGLWVSARSQAPDASLRATYACVLVLSVASLGLGVLSGNVSGVTADVGRWLSSLSPLTALQQITASQGIVAGQGSAAAGCLQFLLASALVTGLFAFFTLRKLNPVFLERPRPPNKTLEAHGTAMGWRRLAYLVDPNRRKAGIPAWLNPILVKEFRTRKFGRLHWLLRLVAGCGIISLLLTALAATGTVSWGVERMAGPLVMLQLALLLLVGPSLGANLISAEVESGGWQILRVTPVSPVRILSGKLMSTVWTMLLVLLATLPGYLVMSYIQPAMSGQVNSVLISLMIAALMIVTISGCVSGFCRTTAVATLTSYAIVLTLFGGTLLVWLGRGQPFGPLLVERVLALNPVAAALSEMQTPGFELYNLVPAAWWIGSAVSLLAVSILAARIWFLTRPT